MRAWERNKRRLEQGLDMRCSHCGLCCEETEMMLSEADIDRLERLGYKRPNFVRYDGHGFARLKNRQGFCVFYDVEKRRCRIYEHRPLGCRLYPVIYGEQALVDALCPMRATVSETEVRRKGKKVLELLQAIDNEAASRRNTRTHR
jgi:Fe-S-cluster containining protein